MPALFKLLSVTGILVALIPTAAAAPLEVILMRHADKDRRRGDYNLSPAGFERAINLARMLPACFGAPSEIITFLLDSQTSQNARSYQSAVPLAVITGVHIHIAQNSPGDSLGIGQRLRQRLAQSSVPQRLVLFWEHRRMPALARGLGWDGMAPVDDQDFDQMFVFRYRSPLASPEVRQYRQSKLFQEPCSRQAGLPWAPPRTIPLEAVSP